MLDVIVTNSLSETMEITSLSSKNNNILRTNSMSRFIFYRKLPQKRWMRVHASSSNSVLVA